jgi:nucleotide-binding universal stress UspA family protein
MLPIHTILHPTDFSRQSAGALHLACALARDHRAHLVILHVATEPVLTFGEAGFPPPIDDCKDVLMDQLQSLEVKSSEVRLSHRVEEGEPGEEIVRVAALCGADLIVMGTHGRRGLARLLMGSVAERVVREAPCPVLTLREPFPPAEALAEAEEALAMR